MVLRSKSYDVVVVGAGVTGLATAFFLRELGIKSVALLSSGRYRNSTLNSAGFISGGQPDNYTRVHHAHGDKLAQSLWAYGDQGFEAMCAFAEEHQIPYARRRRLRLLTTEHELKEATLATSLLAQAGFDITLLSKNNFGPLGAGISSEILAIQDEGEKGGIVKISALMSCLEDLLAGQIHKLAVTSLEVESGGIKASSSAGQSVRAEVCVLASHLASARLWPSLADALVPYTDQWHFARGPRDGEWGEPGIVFSLNHGHIWGATTNQRQIIIGGARFVRPLTGIGATKAEADARIAPYLHKTLRAVFAWGDSLRLGPPHPSLDCWPCDELPIIGPMPGEPRVLIATGYMGQGLAMGFRAGQSIANLISCGSCSSLPRELWPERFRNLS